MKNQILFIFLAFMLLYCKKDNDPGEDVIQSEKPEFKAIKSVEIKDLILDTTFSIRNLAVNKDRMVSVSNSKRHDVFINFDGNDTLISTEILGEGEFRSSEYINEHLFYLSVGSPAKLYKNGELVYLEDHQKAFYDSMEFWNEIEGIAIGDPTDNCMSIIISRDGGDNWTKINCIDLPKTLEGEAAFAASDSNIAIVGDHTWVATGGMESRVMYSPNKGKSWEVFETPIIQGKETTGIYSIDFYDELNGFAIGGDYTDPETNKANKIRTADGGRTWELVADGMDPGYRSCIQYVPEGEAKELIAIGFNGIDYSANAGENWTHLSDEGYYTIRFLNDSTAYAAGKGRISKLIFKR